MEAECCSRCNITFLIVQVCAFTEFRCIAVFSQLPEGIQHPLEQSLKTSTRLQATGNLASPLSRYDSVIIVDCVRIPMPVPVPLRISVPSMRLP